MTGAEGQALASGLKKLGGDAEALVSGKGSVDTVTADGASLLTAAEKLYTDVAGGAATVNAVVASSHLLPATGGLTAAFNGVEKLFGISK